MEQSASKEPFIYDNKNENMELTEVQNKNDATKPAKELQQRKGINERLKEWSQTTSCHGIPHAGTASSIKARMMWSIVVIICVGIFIYQSVQVYKKFQRNEKIVNIELVFENIDFPAVTICNLNPYKKSKIRSIKEVDDMFMEYEKSLAKLQKNQENTRIRRQAQAEDLNATSNIPAYSSCSCPEGGDCIQFDYTPPTSPESTCICVYDHIQDTAWPCHKADDWQSFDNCVRCKPSGICQPPISFHTFLGLSLQNITNADLSSCICYLEETATVTCLKKPDPIITLWEINDEVNTTTQRPETTTRENEDYIAALDFEGTNDEVALVSKAQENLVFTMASLPPVERKEFSYGKREFIVKCSFNSEGCDVRSDFKIFNDATFGNCYTFNYHTNRSSNKAGPLYGLKIMAYVNVSEYMDTSSEAGVRLTIHDTTDVPFPDVFGFNAPTGFLSSFGVRLKRVNRLGEPFGNCTNEKRGKYFIYPHYKYSTEGCRRSCYQSQLVEQCSCGDPRFPILKSDKPCKLEDRSARDCLKRQMAHLGNFKPELEQYCKCNQPCEQWVYEVGYSAAKWPSGSSSNAVDCNMIGMQPGEHCLKHYRKHASMIEVYYEKHGFEWLIESPAYGWVNALGDVGGHIGLYTGISVITVIELFVLLWDLMAVCCFK